MRSPDTAIGLFINVIASGIACVAGLSYVNIRSERHERPMRIALCHMFKMFGFAGTYSIMLFLDGDLSSPDDAKREEFYKILGYCLLGATIFFIFLLTINEVRQRQRLVYNYRDCLDLDNSIANNYCKLFSRNEVLIERSTAGTNMWKSAENLLPKQHRSFSTLWSFYMLLTKLHGAVLFHYFLMTITMNYSFRSFDERNFVNGLALWIMVVSSLIGAISCRIIQIRTVYIWTSIVAVIAMGISIVFYGDSPPAAGVAVCLLIFYAAATISLSIPDIALLEISKIRYNEGMLALGYFAEIIPIAVLQLLQREAHMLTTFLRYTDQYFTIIVISSIVVLLVTSTIFLLHMPSTLGMSLLQIQNGLLKHNSYFAFNFKSTAGNGQIQRTSGENNNHLINETTNENVMFYSASRQSSTPDSTLPPPAVNNTRNFDYDSEVLKTFSIIPRANIVKAPVIDRN